MENKLNIDTECPICFQEFGGDQVIPMMILPCQHTVCQACITKISPPACPICRGTLNERNLQRNWKLEETICAMKKLNVRPVPCVTCGKEYDAEEMLVCGNCIREALKNNTTIDPKEFVVCKNCADQHHLAQGHDIFKYSVLTSGLQFSKQLSILTVSCEEFKKRQHELIIQKFGITVQEFNQEFDRMIALLRRSKTAVNQDAFVGKLASEIMTMPIKVLFLTCIRRAIANR